MDNYYNKRTKRPKNEMLASNPELDFDNIQTVTQEGEAQEPQFALLAKDSEWVYIFPNSPIDKQSCSRSDGEEVLQLVNSKHRPQPQPIASMFPDLLQKDPEMLEGIVNKVMSTTEITKHLVGQKANFACMKKVGRLIPTNKHWLESLTEISISCPETESKSRLQIDGNTIIYFKNHFNVIYE